MSEFAVELFDEAGKRLLPNDLIRFKHYRMFVRSVGRVSGKPNVVPVVLEDKDSGLAWRNRRTEFASETSPGGFRLPCSEIPCLPLRDHL